MEINKQGWETLVNKIGTENIPEWDKELRKLHKESTYPEMFCFVLSLLSTQEEKILHQFGTIDVKMGDPDAEAKVKFAIKGIIRHIKLKNARE